MYKELVVTYFREG